MKFLLRRCNNCYTYSLKERCPKCRSETNSAHSPRYSPDDKYLRYRLKENY